MHRPNAPLPWLLILFILPIWACSPLAVPEVLGGPTSTAPPPTATPEGNVVEYKLAPYEITLAVGDNVPGTQIFYYGQSGDAYQLSLDGVPVEKYSVDSLNWGGIVAPGVTGRYTMRVVPALSGGLTVAGLVDITILEPTPVEIGSGITLSAPIRFSNIPQTYSIEVNQVIPGTTLFYVGETPEGAQLGGTRTGPYRLEGDAVVWTGQLRSNVAVRYDMRVVNFTANRLNLVGTAELWITPAN